MKQDNENQMLAAGPAGLAGASQRADPASAPGPRAMPNDSPGAWRDAPPAGWDGEPEPPVNGFDYTPSAPSGDAQEPSSGEEPAGEASGALEPSPAKELNGARPYWRSNTVVSSGKEPTVAVPETGPAGGTWSLDYHDFDCGPNRWRCRKVAPHSEFDRDFDRLTSSYQVIEPYELREFLYSNCDVLESLFRIMPPLLARPEVAKAQISLLIDFEEACDSAGISVRINYQPPQSLSAIFKRLDNEIIKPLRSFDGYDERLSLIPF